jgi:hypothetical protein
MDHTFVAKVSATQRAQGEGVERVPGSRHDQAVHVRHERRVRLEGRQSESTDVRHAVRGVIWLLPRFRRRSFTTPPATSYS